MEFSLFGPGYGESIAIDADQNIWVSSSFGLFRFDPRQKRFAKIRLPGVNTETTMWIGTIGRMMYLTTYQANVLTFDPLRFGSRAANDPLITAFRIRGKTIPFDRDSVAQFPLRLYYWQNVLDNYCD